MYRLQQHEIVRGALIVAGRLFERGAELEHELRRFTGGQVESYGVDVGSSVDCDPAGAIFRRVRTGMKPPMA